MFLDSTMRFSRRYKT